MSVQGKKFISPGVWFSLIYPSSWNEFEDAEDSFLFYNPNKWTGNFRISAYRDDINNEYGKESVDYELKENKNASQVKLGEMICAYSKEMFQEEGAYYVTHVWITGFDNVAFECTFTVPRGNSIEEAEEIISTLKTYPKGTLPVLEIIPIRVLEINAVNEAFEWTSNTIKKQLKKDFTSVEEDIAKIQQLIESGTFKPQQREVWESFGIAFGTILENQIDGMEWITVIKGKQEIPALRFKESELLIYPSQLVWNSVRSEQNCDLNAIFEDIKQKVEKELN
ncbi:DUF3805 domain-containing protein [uncultured Bacteroides sp.]|uniref:DUF3805 domain-containing protein n=1 Tax=uncultured Bacteroides sp. TaxID=162156 RepID=UPI002AAB08A8|nr:DUF3805 domain-containing protein [uncultured Bacteroides sp.]